MLRICTLLAVLIIASGAWAAELLKDPARSESWRVDLGDVAAATVQSDLGGIRIDVTRVGEKAWSVQLLQPDRTLKQGTRYTLRFAAKASSPRSIGLYGQAGEPPWDHIWPAKNVDLTTEFKTFSFEVTVSRDANGTGRMPVFSVGAQTGSIWIKDASLQDDSGPAPAARDEAVVVVIPEDAALAADLMVNANEPASWTLEPHENVQAEIRQEDGGVRVDVNRNSNERWHLQLHQMDKSLIPGKAYVLKFQARASAPRKMGVVTVQQQDDPWRNYGGSTDVDLTTTWKQYTLKFRVVPDATGKMRAPTLQLGDATGSVWLRNFTLVEAK